MIFGRDFQNGGNWIDVSVQRRPNQLGNVLINEDDADIFPDEKRFEAVVDVADARVFVDDEEIGTPSLVHFPNPAEQKTGTSIFIPNHRYQFSSGPKERHLVSRKLFFGKVFLLLL